MKLLRERTRKDGEALDGDVLKINSFFNHQVDSELMMQVGEGLKRLFESEKITKVLICEASGIVPGIMAAYQLGVSTVLARKRKPSTLNDVVYWADVSSYTKKVNNKVCVEKKLLSSDDHLLIIDDFLVHGEAVKGMLNIAKQADAVVAGASIMVTKEFQGGSDWVKEHGYYLKALARISNSENNQVYFVGEK